MKSIFKNVQIIEHAQGSNAWHVHRAKHLNASDCAAVLGLSSYKTRSQLLKEKATGFTEEVDGATQHRFAKGHEFEATARPWAEEIIGSELYPVVLAGEFEGLNLSASLDGLDMLNSVSFEHKTGRADLLASLESGTIPPEYHPQMEMGLMLSGAGKCLFMASSGNKEAMRFAWYTSNLELRAQIIAAWRQFAADLANFVPTTPTVQAVAAPVESLPAVSVRLDGQLVVASNLPDFAVALRAFIANIPSKPSTDQDFANTESACKALKKAEEALDSAETHALAQMTDVEAMRRTVADLKELARCTRLASEKFVAKRKDQVRLEIVQDGNAALREHIISLNKRLGHPYMPAIIADFAGAIKGKRTIDSLRDAVSTTLANAKIEASAIADKIQFNLETLSEACEFAFLFPDSAQIVQKATDDVKFLVNSRISDHKAAKAREEEATRARIQAEEQEKAERAAREKLAAEQAAADKLAREQAAFEQLERDEIARLAKLNTTMVVEAAPAVTHEAAVAVMPASVRQAMAPKPKNEPTLTLGTISTRLCFNVTSVFLASLGFEATTVKASKLFHEEEFQAICEAIKTHISEVQEQFEAVAA